MGLIRLFHSFDHRTYYYPSQVPRTSFEPGCGHTVLHQVASRAYCQHRYASKHEHSQGTKIEITDVFAFAVYLRRSTTSLHNLFFAVTSIITFNAVKSLCIISIHNIHPRHVENEHKCSTLRRRPLSADHYHSPRDCA